MSHEHELMEELRTAKKSLSEAWLAVREAEDILREKRATQKKALALLDEILDEIEKGTTGRPILDRINERRREEEETADERQRGPTAAKARPVKTTAKLSPAESVSRIQGDVKTWEETPLAVVCGEKLAGRISSELRCETLGDLEGMLIDEGITAAELAPDLGDDAEKLVKALWAWRLARCWRSRSVTPPAAAGATGGSRASSPMARSGKARGRISASW